MAKNIFKGDADTVIQVGTGSIDTVDGTPSDNTFTVTIGGVVVETAGDTDVATTAAALVVLLEASTHPYFAAITWTNPSGGSIVATADTAGVPFIAALTKSGVGSGTVTDFAATTASAGPNHWDTAGNWTLGTVPAASDDVVVENSVVNISYGLDQNTAAPASITIKATYTGKLGLDSKVFATSADGASSSTIVKVEYRETYLKILCAKVDIGESFAAGNPNGSQRIKMNLQGTASTIVVHGTASLASENGLPGIRLLMASASTDVFVRSAPAGVGIAVDLSDETSTVRKVSVSDPGTASKVTVSKGVTITDWEQDGGENFLSAAATVATVGQKGGVLTTEGDFTITAQNMEGGTCFSNNIKTGGDAITTLIGEGGTVDGTGNNQTRTWNTVKFNRGFELKNDQDIVTITTPVIQSNTGEYVLSMS